MSDHFPTDYAKQDPALAISSVFRPLLKNKPRGKLDVEQVFGGSKLHWRAPDALGIPEQSVLLGLLAIAPQQKLLLNPAAPRAAGKRLLAALAQQPLLWDEDLAVVRVSWVELERAAGYSSTGGRNQHLVSNALKRLSETTLWESKEGLEYQSRLLAWICGDDNQVAIVLNRRASSALNGSQYKTICLKERNRLASEPAKALHAWLSGYIRPNRYMQIKLDALQKHIWGDEAIGSTLRSRRGRLKTALKEIDKLERWECSFTAGRTVGIRYLGMGLLPTPEGTIEDAERGDCHREGTIADA